MVFSEQNDIINRMSSGIFKRIFPSRIVLIYAVIGGLWILFSDRIVTSFTTNINLLSRIQTYKGWLYVLITSLLLYALIKVYVSRLEKSEEELKKANEQIGFILSSVDTILYSLKVEDGRFIPEWVSDNIKRLWGYEKEDVLIEDWWIKHIHPDDKEPALKRQLELIEKGFIEHEYRFKAKNGSERWVLDQLYVIYDSSNRPLRITGSWTDITERKAIEEKLRVAYDRLAKIVSTSPGIVCAFRLRPDGSSCFPYGGKRIEETYGIPDARLEEDASPFFALVHPDDLEGLTESIAESARHMSAWRYEWRLCHPVKGEMWIEANSIPLREPDGSILWHGVATDITERKKAEMELKRYKEHLEELVNERTKELEEANERLKELDRLKSMFIASMSHELKTPLNSIIGFSSILLNEWTGPLNEEQKLNLTSINRQGKHLLSLVNDAIDISKIEAGIIDIKIEHFDLDDLIKDAINLVSNDMVNKGLELKMETVHLDMYTDRRRLFQCIINLLSNAIKFTEKGFIKIEVKKINSNNVEIVVEDTGIGIKSGDIPKLFEPFLRLESPLKENVIGTGIGLYLTKKLVKNVLSGDIIAESIYGKGSRFRIRIPVSIGEGHVHSERKEP